MTDTRILKTPFLLESLPVGRPSLYNTALCEAICERLIEGESLRAICRSSDMPAISTVMTWLREYESFREMYIRAREVQADAMFEELLDIADDGRNDYGVDEDGASNGKLDRDHITRSRLRIDTRKWILARMNPKKYGDAGSQKQAGDVQNPVHLLVTQLQGSSVPVVAEEIDDDD